MCLYCEKCALGDIYVGVGVALCYRCAAPVDTTGMEEKYVDYDGQWHEFRFLRSIWCEGCGRRIYLIKNPCGYSGREEEMAELFKVNIAIS